VRREGLWQTDLSKCQGQQEGEVLEIQAADTEEQSSDNDDKDDKVVELGGATQHSDGEHIDANAKMVGDTEHADAEDIVADADMVGATEHSDDEAATLDTEMVVATWHSNAEQATDNPDAKAKAKAEEDDAEDATQRTGATEHGGDDDNAADQKKANAQIFQITISLRDD
jgi:hypothetical protein